MNEDREYDYDVTLKINVIGTSEDDVRDQLSHIINLIEISFGSEIIEIEKVGEYL